MKTKVAIALLFFASFVLSSECESFNVRNHLSTVTRYDTVKDANENAIKGSNIPHGCTAIHLNLVARHGTRGPTKKRIKELDRLAVRLENLLNNAKNQAKSNTLTLQKIPPWMWGWQSPWKGKQTGGELVGIGEEELYQFGIRIREKFPKLFNEEYHPDVFTIRATQVPRASASAVAFGMGLLSGKGNLGMGRHRAFSVISESRASDILLRFFDTCETYKEYRKSREPMVNKLKEPILEDVSFALSKRLQLNFTSQDIASLWFLCKQETTLLDITDRACGLFLPLEVALLEWTDDLEGFMLKGYGESVNYRMGLPLLQDVVLSMEQAIVAQEEHYTPGSFEKARLRFAHAETVVPFSCLLGLFLDATEFERIQNELPLDLPPKPPKGRNWRGNRVAPFAGNNMLVLYKCPMNDSKSNTDSDIRRNYFVQVLHNEVPVPMPGCGGTDLCSYEDFKEKIVNPHLKHDFDSVCNIKPQSSIITEKPCSMTCKLSRFLNWLVFQKEDKPCTKSNSKSEL